MYSIETTDGEMDLYENPTWTSGAVSIIQDSMVNDIPFP